MFSYFQTLSGTPHWPSIITALGWLVTTCSIAAGLHLSRNERISVKSVSGTIFIKFDQPIPAEKIRISDESLFGIAELKKAPLTSSLVLANLTLADYRLNTASNSPAYGNAPVASIRFNVNSEPRLFRTGLGKVRAREFSKTFDYLTVKSLLRVPPNTSFKGEAYLVVNDTLELEYEIPAHHIERVTQLFIPLNAEARNLMREYKMFNPQATNLTYSDLGTQPPTNPSVPAK